MTDTTNDSIETESPPQAGGISARRGFEYQDHVAATFALEMINAAGIEEVWVETIEDIVVVRTTDSGRMFDLTQVKSENRDSYWSIAALCSRSDGKLGTSLIEKSLKQAKYDDKVCFSIVTSVDINNDLDILRLERNDKKRASTVELEDLKNEVRTRIDNFKSGKEHGPDFWVENAQWVVAGKLDDIINKNIVLLSDVLEQQKLSVTNAELRLIYKELLSLIHSKSLASGLEDADAKKMSRDDLIAFVREQHIRIANLKRIHNIPFSKNPFFTGREHDLELFSSLVKDEPKIAVIGAGGMGKTQLVIEYSHKNLDYFAVVWWIKAGSPESITQDLAELALKLGIGDKSDAQSSCRNALRWLEANGPWLLVVDDACDPELIQGLLPAGDKGTLVVTTQDRAWESLARGLSIDVLSSAQSIEMLQKRTGIVADEHASELATELDGLPLALAQAGAYIGATRTTYADYIDKYKRTSLKLMQVPKLPQYPKNVATTWLLSIEKILEEDTDAAILFEWLSFLAGEPIPRKWLEYQKENGFDSVKQVLDTLLRIDELLALLFRYSLINLSSNWISVHKLVQLVARELIPESQQQVRVAESLSIVYEALTQIETMEKYSANVSQSVIAHAKAVLTHLKSPTTLSALTIKLLGTFLTTSGFFAEGEKYLREALTYFAGSPAAVFIKVTLASCLSKQDKFGEAEALMTEALELASNQFKLDDVVVADLQNSLSKIYMRAGKIVLAESTARQSQLKLSSQTQKDPKSDASIMSNRGLSLVLRGQVDNGIELLKAAAEIQENVGETIDLAITLGNLGDSYNTAGNYDEAERHITRSLAILERFFGKNHPDYATALFISGKILASKKDNDAAINRMTEALEIKKKSLGPHHSQMAQEYASLSAALVNMGNLEKAEEFLSKTRNIAQMYQDGKNAAMISVLDSLCEIHTIRGQSAQLLMASRKHAALVRDTYGELHSDYIFTLTRNIDRITKCGAPRKEIEKLKRQLQEIMIQRLEYRRSKGLPLMEED